MAFGLITLSVCWCSGAVGQTYLIDTGFEPSEGWELHARKGGAWTDTLSNADVWEGSNLSGGLLNEISGWVSDASYDGANITGAHGGVYYGVVEHNNLGGDPALRPTYIRTDLVTNPGTVTFWVAKSHRYTGQLWVQSSPDGTTWADAGTFIDGWGSGGDGNTDIPTKITYYQRSRDINLIGDYYIRFIMMTAGDRTGTNWQIDDIQLTELVGPVPTPTVTPTPPPLTEDYLDTSFEADEGWEIHTSGAPWTDILDNGQEWAGGTDGGTPVGWVRNGVGDDMNIPDPRTGFRQGVIEYQGFIQSARITDPGRVTFYVSKSHKYTGEMKMQVSPDGTAWTDTGWTVNGYGDEADGNTQMTTKIVWYPQAWDINLAGQYYIRWIMHDNRGTSNTRFFIDDIMSFTPTGVRDKWEVYR